MEQSAVTTGNDKGGILGIIFLNIINLAIAYFDEFQGILCR